MHLKNYQKPNWLENNITGVYCIPMRNIGGCLSLSIDGGFCRIDAGGPYVPEISRKRVHDTDLWPSKQWDHIPSWIGFWSLLVHRQMPCELQSGSTVKTKALLQWYIRMHVNQNVWLADRCGFRQHCWQTISIYGRATLKLLTSSWNV